MVEEKLKFQCKIKQSSVFKWPSHTVLEPPLPTCTQRKKDGKIATATSYGGRIRVRKYINNAPYTITSESQLQAVIDLDTANNTAESYQSADNIDNSNNIINISPNSTSSQRNKDNTSTPKYMNTHRVPLKVNRTIETKQETIGKRKGVQ